jgi:hypothetical protein
MGTAHTAIKNIAEFTHCSEALHAYRGKSRHWVSGRSVSLTAEFAVQTLRSYAITNP